MNTKNKKGLLKLAGVIRKDDAFYKATMEIIEKRKTRKFKNPKFD